MAAYGAVLSLVQLLHPDDFPAPHRSTAIESLYEKALSLQSSFEGITTVQKKSEPNHHDLDNQVREAVYTAQDKIEDFIFTQLNLSDKHDDQTTTAASTFLQDLQKIEANIDPLVEEAKRIKESDEDKTKDSGAQVSEYIPQPAKERITIRDIKPVGQEEDLEKMKEQVTGPDSELRVFPITGLPGIGKTTLANSLYKDPAIGKEFALRAWVTVSQDCQVGEVFYKLWSSMTTSGQKADDRTKTDQKVEDLTNKVHQELFDKKYLLVVDDIWDMNAWDRIKLSFPDKNNGSRIVLTTRYKEVAEKAKFGETANSIHTMKPLNEDHSWTLLSRIAFKDKTWHSDELKEIAFQIAKNCRGLPLSLTVIGGLLYQASREEEYWRGIQEDTNAAAKKGDDAYLDILELSYNHLPRTLKGCFLYMGAFPEDSEIPASKLVNLWVAEGFLKPPPPTTPPQLEHVAKDNLELLIDRNLLHVRKTTSNKLTKACGMHDSLRDLAVQNCDTEKFFHSRKRYTQELPKGTNTQRRISVHRNILMCLEEVRNSVKEIESARTLIYAGSHHHHPLPFCLTFNLLRVLDAYTVYFLEFPDAIPKLIHLRYLSFTYNGKLPATLSNLQKLQILIARRHPKIVFLGTSFLPDGIWNMPQLRHLLFTESDLPKIPAAHKSTTPTPLFENLQSLSNVSAVTCTEEVIKSMPNLKKLAMWTQKPGPVGLFLNHLQQLESFKFTVLNPNPKSKVEFQPKIYFPNTLIKLRLSGCSLPWDNMEVIGKLPALQVLKLREVAFKGDKWSLKPKMFRELKFLMLEYLDLKKWEADHTHFPKLRSLILRHCYELERIPLEIKNIGPLELIELVDCSPDAVESAEGIMAKVEELGNVLPEVRIYSSWE